MELLIFVECSVQVIREIFSRLHLCRHTFASLWCDCLRFALFWCATHMVIHVSLLFVFLKHTYRSLFVRGLLNLPKHSTPWLKFCFGLSLRIFSMVRHCLWKMCGTPCACINEPGLFSSAAVVPQSKCTELCNWAVIVPHKVNLIEFSVLSFGGRCATN